MIIVEEDFVEKISKRIREMKTLKDNIKLVEEEIEANRSAEEAGGLVIGEYDKREGS